MPRRKKKRAKTGHVIESVVVDLETLRCVPVDLDARRWPSMATMLAAQAQAATEPASPPYQTASPSQHQCDQRYQHLHKMSLSEELKKIDPGLAVVIGAIGRAVSEIAATLRTPGVSETGGTNAFGDKQLLADVQSDKIVFDRLRECGAVATASSEESSDMHGMGGAGFSVAFDPLDGSSIIAANFAVGSIFGVWSGSTLEGRTGREQAAAVYSIYGSRTVLVVARPRTAALPASSGSLAATHCVQEFALSTDGDWVLTRGDVVIKEAKVFAPANLRATADNAAYAALVQRWMQQRYTLRYTGGMVPDVHHILTKGGGIFCSPQSATAPAKLRLLYECAPLAFVVEAAGGASQDGHGSSLARRIESSGDRSVISLGSPNDVASSVASLQS